MTYDYKRLAQIKCFLFDMDGTINLGNELIPGMEGFFDKLKAAGREYYLLTNNSSRSHEHYVQKMNGASAEFFVRCRHGQGYSNSDIDRLNMQRYFYAGLFKRVRSMGVTDVIAQLPLIFNNYIHTDMDLTTIAKMLVSFTRIDSANIMLAQTPVFMGVPNVGKTSSFDGYSCVVPDAGSIAELLNTYFRNYTGPVSAEEMNLVTNNWPHGTASTSANVQFVGQLDKESDDAILSGDTDVAGATTTDGQAAGQ
mgnify:CR=1 FL=1